MAIENFCNVHDSFGTTAADVEVLNKGLREAFIQMFTGDILANFRDDVLRQLPEEYKTKLPEVPQKGDLDINNCGIVSSFLHKKSTYSRQ